MSDDLLFEFRYSPRISGSYPAVFYVDGYTWDEEGDPENFDEKLKVVDLEIDFICEVDEPFGSISFQSDMVSLEATIVSGHLKSLRKGFLFLDKWNTRERAFLIKAIQWFDSTMKQAPFSTNSPLVYCGVSSNYLASDLANIGWAVDIYECPVHGIFEIAYATTHGTTGSPRDSIAASPPGKP
jgi:hypothetical protein